MTEQGLPVELPHRHEPVSTYVLVQRGGIPWELERTVCRHCAQVLSERPLRRAAA
ncbi:MAG: hypothetical protein V7644_1296 [Actinomycetota bacterium]|jgi:hypothetical protein